jgi:hypothetical protein
MSELIADPAGQRRVCSASKREDGANVPWKGPLSYSLLKLISDSPAAFRHACEAGGIEVTEPMKLGTCAHWHLLGGPPERKPLVYSQSKTRGEGAVRAWREFQEAHQGEEIFSLEQWNEGLAISNAIRYADHNYERYNRWIAVGDHEVPLRWTRGGFDFATRGVDVLRATELVDVKTARCVEPHALMRQAQRLHYPEQLALYRGAARANGYPVDTAAVFAVCSSPPYVTRVLRFSAEQIDAADATVDRWIDTVRRCVESDEWPGGGEDDYVAPWSEIEGEGDLEAEHG